MSRGKLPVLVLAVVVLACTPLARAGSHTSPPSAAFRVDTRAATVVRVTGVSSRWCDGAYGGAGRHVYFLAGVNLPVVFTAQVEWGGRTGSRIEFNGVNNGLNYSKSIEVGGLGAGGKLEVVAVATDGTRSPAFRANFDVAPLPPFADMVFYPQAFTLNNDLSYSTPAFNLGMFPGRSGVVQGCPLPGETMEVAPSLNAAAAFNGDGTLTIRAAAGVNNDIKLNGTQSRRPDGKFGKAAGVDFGFDIEGEIVRSGIPTRVHGR